MAAVSVVSPLFSLSAAVATMLGSGGCALIARALGSDDIKQAKAYASLCGWGSIGFGLLITVVLLLAREMILPALGHDGLPKATNIHHDPYGNPINTHWRLLRNGSQYCHCS